jgi:hypothetical protein
MIVGAARASRSHWVEWFLALLVLLVGLRSAYYTWEYGYLPAPFYPDSTDTFRDWFSVANWAHVKGAYDTWLAVYPPLSFLLIKYMGLPACYAEDMSMGVRECDWIGIVLLHLFVVLNGIVASITYMRLDRRTALPRAFTLTAGMPMLFGLERGNIILLCITTCMLAWGPLVKSARLRWIFAGLAVNFKVYLIAGVLVHLVRRRWRAVEGGVLATVGVYIVSYALYGEGTPGEVVANLINFAQGFYSTEASAVAIWYNSTYDTLYKVLTESNAPVVFLLGSTVVDRMTLVLQLVIRASQLTVLLAMVATWLRPEVVTPHRLTTLGLGFVMMLQENPPYALPIMFYFVFMERSKGWLVPCALMLTYLVSLPGDLNLGSPVWVEQYSYIGDRYVASERALQLGMFIRPLGHTLIPVCLALDTILTVLRDVREDGWQWRWRFRHDAPLLPRVKRPRPPLIAAGDHSAA